MIEDNVTKTGSADLRDVSSHTRDELDDVFHVLSNWQRRAILTELVREGTTEVEALAARIASADGSRSPNQAKIGLIHTHLPKMAEAGILTYDQVEGQCELDDPETGTWMQQILETALDERRIAP